MQFNTRCSNKWIPRSYNLSISAEWFVVNNTNKLTKYGLTLLYGQLVTVQILSCIFGHVAVLIRSCRLCSLQEFAPAIRDLPVSCPSRWSPDRGGNFTRTGHVKKLTIKKLNFFSCRSGICIWRWPTNYNRHLAWAKRASLNGGKWWF